MAKRIEHKVSVKIKQDSQILGLHELNHKEDLPVDNGKCTDEVVRHIRSCGKPLAFHNGQLTVEASFIISTKGGSDET